MCKIPTYWDEIKQLQQVFHVGVSGKEIIITPDGQMRSPRLTKDEREELNVLRKTRKLLAQASAGYGEYYHLDGIPYTIELDYLNVMKEIVAKKMTPSEAKAYLLELERYHALMWRG